MSAAHILVVDDEDDIRTTISDILEDEGYAVSVAADAASARGRSDFAGRAPRVTESLARPPGRVRSRSRASPRYCDADAGPVKNPMSASRAAAASP